MKQLKTYGPALAILSVCIVAALLLHQQERQWICRCGRVDLWAGDIWSSDNSQHLFDPYSFTHVLYGFLFFWLINRLLPRLRFGWQLWLTVLLGAVWEVVENSQALIQRYRTVTLALGYNGDTIVNSISDILLCGAGVLLARRIGFWRTIALFAATELILVLWIRDSLVLNVLMLLHPIDAIRNWQIGQ